MPGRYPEPVRPRNPQVNSSPEENPAYCAASVALPRVETYRGEGNDRAVTAAQRTLVYIIASAAVIIFAYLGWSAYRGSLFQPSTFWVAIGLGAGMTAGLAFVREGFLSTKGTLARACFSLVGLILVVETSVLLRAALR
jgi:hypothetical protein